MVTNISADDKNTTELQSKKEKFRVLLAEDDEDVNFITRMMLERFGYEVVSTFNGLTALKLYNDSFDIIVTDIVMPEMGGAELILELRKLNPNVKCIAITGFPNVEIPNGIPVLLKPVSTTQLLETLNAISGKEIVKTLVNEGD